MAKMALATPSFTLIPEGTHTFKIMEVDESKYEMFGKLSVKMQTAEGKTHMERFTLTRANGEINEGALKAWSFFARVCLNNYKVEEIDTQDIVGCYIKADVVHESYPKKDGTTGTTEKLKNYSPASGFVTDAEVEQKLDDIGISLDDDDLNF